MWNQISRRMAINLGSVQPKRTAHARVVVTTAAAAALVILLVGSHLAGTSSDVDTTSLYSILRSQLQFSNSEMSALTQGRAVVKTLPPTMNREMTTACAVRIRSDAMWRFVNQFKTLEGFKTSQFVLQIQKFSDPPQLSNLDSLWRRHVVGIAHRDGAARRKCQRLTRANVDARVGPPTLRVNVHGLRDALRPRQRGALGRVELLTREDAVVIQIPLFLVADGMGGHQAGERASTIAVAAIEQFTLNTIKWFFDSDKTGAERVLAQFQSAVRQADARILAAAADRPDLSGMGTTVTMAFQLGAQLCVVHVGDSRA